jgi:glucose-1-phosphate adenylyltransferase
MVGEGSILNNCKVSHSIIGLRSRISDNARISDAIVMGADFYQFVEDIQKDLANGTPPIGIGKNCVIKNAIIDKNSRIGDNAKLLNEKKVVEFTSDRYCIVDGVIMIPKNSVIPPNTVI